MHQHHDWNVETLENMVAWEFEVYKQMTEAFVESEKQRLKAEAEKYGRR